MAWANIFSRIISATGGKRLGDVRIIPHVRDADYNDLMTKTTIKTLGELKRTDYKSRSVKDELRDNLIAQLKRGEGGFEGIVGFEDTVIPDLQTAILSRHNILLLGLRGQAKTRIARLMVNLLDEYVPYIEGSELYDDPLKPISWFAHNEVITKADNTPIGWVHRSERYTEKLATPDVT